MKEEKDVITEKRTLAKAIELIPIKLLQQEETLLTRIKASQRNSLAKLSYLFEFMDEISNPFQQLTPCEKGCSHCCHIRVDISALEVLNIKKHVKSASKSLPQGLTIGDPCPFLKNNICSIYEFRPFVCRRHQVLTPSSLFCKPEHDTGRQLLNFTEVDKSFSYILSEYGAAQMKDIRDYFSG